MATVVSIDGKDLSASVKKPPDINVVDLHSETNADQEDIDPPLVRLKKPPDKDVSFVHLEEIVDFVSLAKIESMVIVFLMIYSKIQPSIELLIMG